MVPAKAGPGRCSAGVRDIPIGGLVCTQGRNKSQEASLSNGVGVCWVSTYQQAGSNTLVRVVSVWRKAIWVGNEGKQIHAIVGRPDPACSRLVSLPGLGTERLMAARRSTVTPMRYTS